MSEDISIERVLSALRTIATPDDLALNVLVRTGHADRYSPIDTPIGRMFVTWNDTGVSLMRPAKTAAEFETLVVREVRRRAVAAPLPRALGEALERRFAGELRTRIPVDLRSRSDFARAVLERTARIPRGEMKSYAWVAAQIGKPRAVRAVGTALGTNPVPLIIPCHRVVPSSGGIGNYVFGTLNKASLLTLEGAVF